jgi:cysteinyl-tRNA synthetase
MNDQPKNRTGSLQENEAKSGEPSKLYFFNTLGRTKELFAPIEPGRVGVYCCGPTVYNYAHIGNLRTYIFEDILVRTLREAGYDVTHVMNVTDVGHLQSDADEGQDKMTLAAEREQRSPWQIARFYEEAFLKDCAALGIRRPDIIARATEHVPEMIEFVETLHREGTAYEIDGNIYFDTSTRPNYNELRGGAVDDEAAVSRVEADRRKRHHADFVLWFSKSKFPNQIMKWDSPWGTGFPGWHIECSAMASKYLGPRIDIHCGGIDHIPIHHTNEIAQSEACFHHRWVNTWMHGAFLILDKGKMSKSAGTFITLATLEEMGFKPLHYRYLCLSAHYRSELRFSWEALEGARRGLENLYNRIISLRLSQPAKPPKGGRSAEASEAAERHRDAFKAALADDLNAPIALSILWSAMKDPVLDAASKLALAGEFDRILGLGLMEASRPELPEDAMRMIREREEARGSGDWTRADEIRNRLSERGIMVKDTKQGTEWYLSVTD